MPHEKSVFFLKSSELFTMQKLIFPCKRNLDFADNFIKNSFIVLSLIFLSKHCFITSLQYIEGKEKKCK